MDNIGMNAIKYLLFIFNLIFLISGIGITVAGGLIFNEVYQYSHFLDSKIITPPIILIVAGVLVFFVAFLGCYGAIKENFIMLIAFAVALLIIFLIEMGVGIAAAVFANDFKKILKKSLKSSITNNSDADKLAWMNIQNSLQCCGVDSKYDWVEIMPNGTLPHSCCTYYNDQLTTCTITSENVFRNNCYTLIATKMAANANLLIGIGIGIAFVEVVGIVLACGLAMAIRREGNK